jgi:hypothetical protein
VSDLTLSGQPLSLPRARQRRAVPLDPTNPKTWQEVADLQPRLKERLRLGAWIAWHVRKQGDRARWGSDHAGILETVPPAAAWGVLDWTCVPSTPDDHLLWIELKSERGKLTEPQAVTAQRLARAGQEVVVLRPRHFIGRHGDPDMVFLRLVNHEWPLGWTEVSVAPDMSLPQVLAL